MIAAHSGGKRETPVRFLNCGAEGIGVGVARQNRQALDRSALIDQDTTAALRCGVEVGMGVQYQTAPQIGDVNEQMMG